MNISDAAFGNLELIENFFSLYQKDPHLLDPSWRHFFEDLKKLPEERDEKRLNANSEILSAQPIAASNGAFDQETKINALINGYRRYGHLMSRSNPIYSNDALPPQLELKNFGLDIADLDKNFPDQELLRGRQAPLQEILARLHEIYCSTLTVEYMNCSNMEIKNWLQQELEQRRLDHELTIEQKKAILQDLNRSELFETFLQTKYTGQKRFSLEGGETLIPMLGALIDKGAAMGIVDFVLGMAHRGRLNVLCNILEKPYAMIFSEFDEGHLPDSWNQSGDVKYHKGYFSETISSHGHKVGVTLTPNPSHLEAVNPVVEGQVFAKQQRLGKEGKKKVMPILIHGDAALAGQGIVYETIQMADLKGYGTGGTIHLVINNQIGFTTVPQDSRSTVYCTDIAKAFECPTFHVNAEDPEASVLAIHLALELRQKFGCDVFVDLLCYRKYGHNETDEPAFTQPQKYQIINKKKSVREIYREHLVGQGVLENNIAEELEADFKTALQNELAGIKANEKKMLEEELPEIKPEKFSFNHIQTGVSLGVLQEIAEKVCAVPEGFAIHPKLERIIKERLSMVKGPEPLKPIDWGMAETLAFGSLLWEGAHVRLSGQDSCRGTFSHRHAMWMDQNEEKPYYPLQHLKPGQGEFEVYNSPLSEFGVLGFEFGYSLASPNALVLWEAQFGDFCNGAQVIIDQFISTGEQKWGQQFGLTMLLPHGYEGQGPEHSSGRMERFLTLAGQSNICIVNPSTPAQFFHLLRRQQMQKVKKPLIVFTPKALLRHPECVNQLQDLTMGSFQEVMDDPQAPEHVQRVAICSGHVYYDLIAEKRKGGGEDLALLRVEQLYPFDKERMKGLLNQYRSLQTVYWVQEEPSNMGAGQFMSQELQEIIRKEIQFKLIARPRSASPAVGSYAMHKKQLKDLLGALFGESKPSIFDLAAKKK